jgi:hypothetical protein
MSAPNEEHAAIASEGDRSTTTNGLTITRPSPARQQSSQGVDVLSTIEDVDSSHTLTPTHTLLNEKISSERDTSPLSTFYNTNPTRHFLEAQKSESKQNINIINSSYDTDIEACLTPQKTEAGGSSHMALLKSKSRKDDCPVWPGQQQMKKKKKMMRKERGKHNLCGWMAGMSKTTQMWIKISIALLVIGAAIGIGIGVSKAVGGGIWKSSNNTNAPIKGSGT